MGVIAEGILRGCQGLFTPVSLGYPLSVFNKNSTLKRNDQRVCISAVIGLLAVWRHNKPKTKPSRTMRRGSNTARSVEDETRNAESNGNRNSEWWGDFSQQVKIEKIKFLGMSRYKVELSF